MKVYVVMYLGDVEKIFADEVDAQHYVQGVENLHEIKECEVIM